MKPDLKGDSMPVDRDAVHDDELVRYLLGELSEAASERLEELSVVEDTVAERLRLVEDDLVDAYARGRLSGGHLTRFEAFYLASPQRRRRAAFARRLADAVDADAARAERASGIDVHRRSGGAKVPPARAARL
jgi:hypothetical protein